MLRRFIYLIYYLKKREHLKIKIFLRYASKLTGKSKLRLIVDMLASVFRYNTSLKDYFYFRFFEKESYEREKWAGSGFMYEYQLLMNPIKSRHLLENKLIFINYFSEFVKRRIWKLDDLLRFDHDVEEMFKVSSGLLVLKNSMGQAGAEVEVIEVKKYDQSLLLDYMKSKKYDIIEEYIIQHPSLMSLSPSGLNTVRIITQLEDGKIDIIGARLRITVNSQVDNMAAGNLAAPVDILNGEVIGPGVYSDITKENEYSHPVTRYPIEGYKIPYWKETVLLVERAALSLSQNRSVGWDIAITEKGPELIEGNHNWCKLLWQLPVNEGLKSQLDKYF